MLERANAKPVRKDRFLRIPLKAGFVHNEQKEASPTEVIPGEEPLIAFTNVRV